MLPIKNKMFSEVTRTWNPVPGCRHDCNYCFARELAEGRLRHLPRYADGFTPKLIEEELRRRFHKGLIFVCDMGDLFGEWVPGDWIRKVLDVVRQSPKAEFLFLTKNPARYHEFRDESLPNVIWGATIETNRDIQGISQAPSPTRRYEEMTTLRSWQRRIVSIEPIMDFDLQPLVRRIRQIGPEFIYIGFDNHGHHLPEPPLAKTLELIQALEQFTEVRLKTIRKAHWEG